MAALFRLGQTSGAKAKALHPTGAAAKAITDTSALHTAPEANSGTFSATYTSLKKSGFQLAGQNAEQFL